MRRGENVLPLATLRNVRRSKKYGPHHTWKRRTWPIGNGSQLKAMSSVTTILMKGKILGNNLLECYFDRQPINHNRWCNGKPTGITSWGTRSIVWWCVAFRVTSECHNKMASQVTGEINKCNTTVSVIFTSTFQVEGTLWRGSARFVCWTLTFYCFHFSSIYS